jgi:hypothetical protein
MKENNLIRLARSWAILPIITVSLTFGGVSSVGVSGGTAENVLVQKVNTAIAGALVLNNETSEEALHENTLKLEAEAIDKYFEKYDMPLFGLGRKMVDEAELHGIDWRLLPAITVRESTGGKNACIRVKFNPFGWGSCKIGFKSYEEAIEIVAKNLGGNNPNTAFHYDNKTTLEILKAYNPPSIVPNYAKQVISIMNAIGDKDLGTISPSTM